MWTGKGTALCQAHGRRCRPYEALYHKLTGSTKERIRQGRRPFLVLLSYEEFLKFVDIKQCHYCEAEIQWALPHGIFGMDGKRNVRTHIDRKDSAKNYTKENCVVCCDSCNRTKSNRLSYDEMIVIGRMRKQKREGLTNV